ncbi:G-protein coupled receptor Mth2-like [Cataglyphis hispanica]|uniref:G-protein coupled receptor Mth2-like n=1 Tax=Cataglyphis hispanica TaxID=1086592 RepID=UPI00217F7236|nr:G-protein coupled receptor Mth2-like [Cataglyphis hispanica]
MCGKNFVFGYCALLLFIALSSKSQQNSTSNEKKNNNLTIRYEMDTDSTTNYGDEMKTLLYDLHEKFTKNTQYKNIQYESHTSMSSDREDDDSILYKLGTQNHEDNQTSMEPHTNSSNVYRKKNFMSQDSYENLMRIENKNNSMLHKFFENSNIDSNINNITSYEMCYNITCIQLCCPLGDRLDDEKCISEKNKYFFPNVYGYINNSLNNINKTVNELFQLVVYDPCQDKDRFLLPDGYQYDYMFLTNGSLYLSYYKIFAKLSSYCLAVIDGDKFEVTICSETSDEVFNTTSENTSPIEDLKIIYLSFHIVSILFLVSIFLVYSILPELRNIHGFILRNYTGALSIAYTIDIVNILIKADAVKYPVCVTVAFFNYFCFLTSFLWLNIMSFDMWWTFRGFCSLQRNVRQREKKKLIFYMIFAWGLPFIFAIISVIMDSVSEYLPDILRPGFREGDCWFDEKGAFVLYFYGFKSICIISSICLSISTALKIVHYKKETVNRLTDSESKRYNDNKKWFNLYLKLFIVLFIVMGLKWSIMTTSFLSGNISKYISYAINLVDIVQNLCTFIIFVWKKKIKRMLLKRFGFGLLPESQCATNTTNTLSTTSICITTSEEMPMQSRMNSCE